METSMVGLSVDRAGTRAISRKRWCHPGLNNWCWQVRSAIVDSSFAWKKQWLLRQCLQACLPTRTFLLCWNTVGVWRTTWSTERHRNLWSQATSASITWRWKQTCSFVITNSTSLGGWQGKCRSLITNGRAFWILPQYLGAMILSTHTRFFSFLVFSSLFFFRKKGIGNRYAMDESRCVEGLITHLLQFQVLYKD